MKKKKIVSLAGSAILVSALSFMLLSCDKSRDYEKSQLCISFADGVSMLTRAYGNLPDTSDFILRISDSSGRLVYDGDYGSCPELIDVAPGTYNVYVTSCDFVKPTFDLPQFGDEQCVVVPPDSRVRVELVCGQMNAGMRLKISSEFLDVCPDAVLFLKSEDGKLMYSYSEKRTAFFKPGQVSLVMSTGGQDDVLMVRELVSREMVTLKVTAKASEKSSAGGMSVSVDTSRVWIEEEFMIGSISGESQDDALSVADARKSVGQNDVWVCGYIVGGDLTSTSASFKVPFESQTNILLGPKANTKDKNSCVSVQLPSGDVREKLNLVDNPGILGRRVCLKGDIVESYYGIPGVKNTSEYKLL